MFQLSNIRIGTKLAMISGVALLLVLAMIGVQLLNNAKLGSAAQEARLQNYITLRVADIKDGTDGMQLAIRDLRLARAAKNFEAAKNDLDHHFQIAIKNSDEVLPKFTSAENRERVQKVKGLAEQYYKEAQQIVTMRGEIIQLEAKRAANSAAADPVAAQISALTDKVETFARERTLPIAGKLDSLANEAADVAEKRVEAELGSFDEVLTSVARFGLVIGFISALVLIGSAVFGVVSIARPLGKMAGVLVELTNDRIVDVPYTARADEIGAIAKATELFKQSIAEKVINLRVRSALDVVKSNVMVADGDYNIMYMNSTLKEMLREAEPELRKVLPSFDSARLIGANMDVFHKDPAHQRKVMDALTGTRESHITVGTQKFHHIATPVIDQHGKRSGTVVEWRNETVEKAIEGEIDDIAKAAVAGEFGKRVPLEGKQGFMLNLANAMNSLCDNTGKALEDLAGMMGALAIGDLSQRISAEYQGMFGKLKTDANMMAERIGATIAEIKASASEVTNASAEISTSTTDLSQRTEEQAASLEETSASMEQISATVKKNAENAQAANQSASGTREVANRGGQVVAKAVEAMAQIEESSRKISDIIGVIDEIARQTNLLALNAAVEAARAGEAGRGFAVVASEVRSLAQRSSQAAKDIKDLITNSNGQVKDGVDLVNRAGTSLTEIVESIKKVSDIVADIANASAEQATGIEQVNKALNQMDEVTQQNSALVEENAATAKTLEHQAKAMDERVAFFRLDNAAEVRPTAAREQRPAAAMPSRGPAVPKRQPVAAPKRAAAGANGAGPVRRMQAALATAVNADQDWKEF